MQLIRNTSGQDNFSYEAIMRHIVIPLYQQMVVFGLIQVEEQLTVEGTLILED